MGWNTMLVAAVYGLKSFEIDNLQKWCWQSLWG
jgi:hypothetical protein